MSETLEMEEIVDSETDGKVDTKTDFVVTTEVSVVERKSVPKVVSITASVSSGPATIVVSSRVKVDVSTTSVDSGNAAVVVVKTDSVVTTTNSVVVKKTSVGSGIAEIVVATTGSVVVTTDSVVATTISVDSGNAAVVVVTTDSVVATKARHSFFVSHIPSKQSLSNKQATHNPKLSPSKEQNDFSPEQSSFFLHIRHSFDSESQIDNSFGH